METSTTWPYLRYVAGAGHFMTELVADLEIELRKRDITIETKTKPGNPPPIPAGGDMCFPPNHCLIPTAELLEYTNQLGTYVNQVFLLATEHITAARGKGVTEFSYRIVATPMNPKK